MNVFFRGFHPLLLSFKSAVRYRVCLLLLCSKRSVGIFIVHYRCFNTIITVPPIPSSSLPGHYQHHSFQATIITKAYRSLPLASDSHSADKVSPTTRTFSNFSFVTSSNFNIGFRQTSLYHHHTSIITNLIHISSSLNNHGRSQQTQARPYPHPLLRRETRQLRAQLHDRELQTC